MTATPVPGWPATGPEGGQRIAGGASGKAGRTGVGIGVEPGAGISPNPAADAMRSAISAGAGRSRRGTDPSPTEKRSPKSLKTPVEQVAPGRARPEPPRSSGETRIAEPRRRPTPDANYANSCRRLAQIASRVDSRETPDRDSAQPPIGSLRRASSPPRSSLSSSWIEPP